jgi:hypothetical protein
LLAVERKAAGDVIGYYGLIDGGQGIGEESEPAFELLRRAWGRGYATEASKAILDWASTATAVSRTPAPLWTIAGYRWISVVSGGAPGLAGRGTTRRGSRF